MTTRWLVPMAVLSLLALSLLMAVPGRCEDIRLMLKDDITLEAGAKANLLPVDATLAGLLSPTPVRLGNQVAHDLLGLELTTMSSLCAATNRLSAESLTSLHLDWALDLDAALRVAPVGQQLLETGGLRLVDPDAASVSRQPYKATLYRFLMEPVDQPLPLVNPRPAR